MATKRSGRKSKAQQEIEQQEEIEMINTCALTSKDPYAWVLWAFDWGNGELKDYDGPEPWQQQVLEDLRNGLITLREAIKIAVTSGHGIGKAQPKTLFFDTPQGIRRWGEIVPGDYVFGSDGKPTRVIARHERGTMGVYRVTFDDGSSTLCCGDHVWKVRSRAQRRSDRVGGSTEEWIELTTSDLISKGVKRSNGKALARQWEIPQQGIVEYRHRDVPVEAYVIGAWLGDGGRTRASITTNDREVMQHIRALGYEVSEGRKQGTTAVTAYIRGIKHYLRDMGILDKYSYEKAVPQIYKENSPEVRAEILRGLLDTDGEVTKNSNSIGYSSTSRQLIEDVIWLARSLGGKAKLQPTVKHPTYKVRNGESLNGRDCYRATIQLPPDFKPFYVSKKGDRVRPAQRRYLTRWIDKIEFIGQEDCMCITVEAKDGLYLTNDFIVTHNSALVAWLILWAMSTCEDCKGVVTANTESQLKTKTWAELGKWHRLCITKDWFVFTATALYSTDKTHEKTWRIDMVPWSERNTEAFAGLHNQGKRILVIFDEASAIPDMIHEVTEGALTDSDTEIVWIQFGNPTRNVGRFFQCFNRFRHRWITHKVDSRTVSFTNKAQIQQWADDYGDDSDFFRVRVKGEFPRASTGQFIPGDIVDAALGKHIREEEYNFAPKIIGVDCARFGDDRSVIFRRQGLASFTPKAFSGIDTAELADRVAIEIVEWDPDAVMIDVGAMGAGVIDILRRAGHKIIEVNFGSASMDPSCYLKRTEIWKKMRDWLRSGGVLPNVSELRDDLTGPEYTYDNKTRFVLESKKHMKETRGLASPDYADALAVTFAIPVASRSFSLKAMPDNKQAILSKRRLRRGR